MNLDRFVAERSDLWEELAQRTSAAKGRPDKLDPSSLLRLGDLYRAAAADLAFARRRWPSERVVERLEELVNRGRVVVYGTSVKRGSVKDFFAREYWQRIMERRLVLLVSALLLFTPMVLTAAWAAQDPAAASNLVPSEYGEVSEPKQAGEDLGLSTGEEAAFSSLIFTNNIRVTFLAFAAGIVVALGAAALLIYNAVFIGALTGMAIDAGNGGVFMELVVAHGVLELSCIVVAGAAGMRLGWALVAPGPRRRIDAVMEEGRKGIEIILGTMPWLVLAGLVEGFLTPAGAGLLVNSIVGVALGAIYWGFAVRLGRPSLSEELRPRQSRTLALARR